MFRDPAFDDADYNSAISIREAPLDETWNQAWRNSDYGINVAAYSLKRFDSGTPYQTLYESIREGDMRVASEHLAVVDTYFIAADPNSPYYSGGNIRQRGTYAIAGIPTTSPGEHVHPRHGSGAANILWGDGHAASFGFTDIYKPYDDLNGYNFGPTLLFPNKINYWDSRNR